MFLPSCPTSHPKRNNSLSFYPMTQPNPSATQNSPLMQVSWYQEHRKSFGKLMAVLPFGLSRDNSLRLLEACTGKKISSTFGWRMCFPQPLSVNELPSDRIDIPTYAWPHSKYSPSIMPADKMECNKLSVAWITSSIFLQILQPENLWLR